jgi:hypothetical protein
MQSGDTLDWILFVGVSPCRPGSNLATKRIQPVRKSRPNEPHLAFAVPGDLATPTGGCGYDRRIIQELRELGWQADVADIGGDFPFPSTAERATALAILSTVPAGCPIVLDGLAFGALPEAGSAGSVCARRTDRRPWCGLRTAAIVGILGVAAVSTTDQEHHAHTNSGRYKHVHENSPRSLAQFHLQRSK